MNQATDIAVLSLERDLDVTTVESARGVIDSLIDQGCKRVILNMGRVSYVDSAGMSLILVELRRMRAQGGLLSLVDVSHDVYRTLATLRMLELMPVRPADDQVSVPELAFGAEPIKRTVIHVTPTELFEVRHRIADLLCELALSPDERFDLELASGEALSNAVDHSHSQEISASVAAYTDRVIVEVEDCGIGFTTDVSCAAAPDAGIERGRGIYLMRLLVDSVTITQKAHGKGTLVRLVKLVH